MALHITPSQRFLAISCAAQPGCSGTPPFGKKSAWPSIHGYPTTIFWERKFYFFCLLFSFSNLVLTLANYAASVVLLLLPNKPPSVCITSTNLASDRLKRLELPPLYNGNAGSKPIKINKIVHTNSWNDNKFSAYIA